MPKLKIRVHAPGGTGRIELENAKFERLEMGTEGLNEMRFGSCDDENLRFEGGGHMWFNADVRQTAKTWIIRMYGEQGKCSMWIDYDGTIYKRNPSDGRSTSVVLHGFVDDLIISQTALESLDADLNAAAATA